MNFIPFDIKCYSRLSERFEYIFEEELINEICRYGQVHTYASDDMIIDIGENISHMPLVINGAIKVLTEDEDGQDLLLYYLELGDTCAVTLNCCTKKSKSNIRAIAETDSELLFIPVEKMDEWMVKYQSWRAFVLESYNTRLNEMLHAIDNLVFHSMEDRIKKYLVDKAWATKSEELKVSHQEIARDLHSSRVVISRIMKKLEKEGFLRQQRGHIHVLKIS